MAKALKRTVSIYINGTQVTSTINELTKQMNILIAKQKGMTIGSEEYVETSLKIKEIKSVLAEQKREIQESSKDWKDAREAAADYADIIVGLKTDLYVALYARVNIDGLRHIAYRSECKLPAIMTCYLKVSIDIGSHTYPMAQVLSTGKRYRFTGLGIKNLTGNSLLCPYAQGHQQQTE